MAGGLFGLLIGLFLPFGLITAVGSGLLGNVAGKKVPQAMEKKAVEDMRNELMNMDRRGISDTMDNVIGLLLIIIEFAGLVLGILAALLL